MELMGASIHLFLRLLLGLICLSTSMSKFAHRRRLQQGIRDYQIVPPTLDTRFAFSRVLSFCIPLLEVGVGLGLISSYLFEAAVIIGGIVFIIFTFAIIINLFRGRTDLSCHCGGIIGNHIISWWLVGRNCVLVLCFILLLCTPPDSLTMASLSKGSSLSSNNLLNTTVPVIMLVGIVACVLVLLNFIRVIRRSL